MSNEYKDWIRDAMADIALDRRLVDKITSIYPDPIEGTPKYVLGLKNGQPVKYEIWIGDDGEWIAEHRELDT